MGDTGIAASLGAFLAAAYVHTRDFLKGRKNPGQLTGEHDVERRLDLIEQEQHAMRKELQALDDLRSSVEEIKTSQAVTNAILPRVEKQLDALAESFRKGRGKD